jgi:polysaccharide deacetylase family protein (PEP-CTERM system associated)
MRTSRGGAGRSGLGLPEEIVNALTVDVEASGILGTDGPHHRAGLLARLLDVLDAYRARGTFFVLGVVARRDPRLVREIVARGHDVACHGWDNTPVYRLGPAGFRADARRAKHAVEQAVGRFVRGYRAPSHSIRRDTPWAFTVLAEEGFVYDSSMIPLLHERSRIPDATRFPHVARIVDGIEFWEIPLGTARVAGLNVPLGGRFLDLFPAALVRRAIAGVNARERRAIVYVHPCAPDSRAFGTAQQKLPGLLEACSFASIEAVFEEVRPAARRLVVRAS